MVIAIKQEAPSGTSLRSLVQGFLLTQKTDGKSPRTVEYYVGNLRRFLWFAERQHWSDDARQITEWEIREFLAYVSGETFRWGLKGNGAESSQKPASRLTIYHYYVVLKTFFNWCCKENYLTASPLAKYKFIAPKPKIIQPYTEEEINKLLLVCDYDFGHNAKLLGARNRAIILVLLDTGLRVSDVFPENSYTMN